MAIWSVVVESASTTTRVPESTKFWSASIFYFYFFLINKSYFISEKKNELPSILSSFMLYNGMFRIFIVLYFLVWSDTVRNTVVININTWKKK
jgi:hypothetical protein